MDLDNSIEKTLSEIQKLMNANSIIGNPITAKDKVIIPISKTALGFGVGVANNSGKNDTGLGGAGGGGSIDPVAFIIVHTDIQGPGGVEVLPVNPADSPLDSILSGIVQTAFDFINNSNVEPAVESPEEKNIDKIKTKIKNKKDN